MRYFSLFSGIGGFELGFPQQWECIGFSETDKWAVKIYQKHFPLHKNYGDAKAINPDELPDFDLLCGGFPCQAFSIAGKRRGFEDIRGTLFFEIARIAKIKRPSYLLLENVKGLLSSDKGNTFAAIIETLSNLGYDLQWECLNSKHFGVPQNRERVFIVGYLREQPRPQIFPVREGNLGSVETPRTAQGKRAGVRSEDSLPNLRVGGEKGLVCVDTRTGSTARGQDFIVQDGFGHGWQGYHDRKIHKKGLIRRLTPIECERLQGFPDRWTEGISDTQRYKCLGNAVTVNVIREIAQKLSKDLAGKMKV